MGRAGAGWVCQTPAPGIFSLWDGPWGQSTPWEDSGTFGSCQLKQENKDPGLGQGLGGPCQPEGSALHQLKQNKDPGLGQVLGEGWVLQVPEGSALHCCRLGRVILIFSRSKQSPEGSPRGFSWLRRDLVAPQSPTGMVPGGAGFGAWWARRGG